MYNCYKSFEDTVLYQEEKIENLRTYVVCSGVTYGAGEDRFFDLFKQAWT